MQAHVSRSFLAKNCIFTHPDFKIKTWKKFPLLLPSHNCIIITMFSFQGTWWVSFARDSMKSQLSLELQSISFEVVEISGIEPLTSWMPFKRSPSWAIPPYLHFQKWWAKMDSNHRPHDYQSCALASWAIGPSWWRLAGSNRWPPACKAGALPAELNPRNLSIFIIRYILLCTL